MRRYRLQRLSEVRPAGDFYDVVDAVMDTKRLCAWSSISWQHACLESWTER